MPEQAELQRKTGQRGLWLPATRGLKKDSYRAITPAAEAGSVPAHLVLPGSSRPRQLCHLHAQPSLGKSCHRQKKSLVSKHGGLLQLCPTLWNPVDCGLPGFSVRRFSRQEYWSILANSGCHTLLENYISCCPHCNSPEYLVLSESLWAKQLHHLLWTTIWQ